MVGWIIGMKKYGFFVQSSFFLLRITALLLGRKPGQNNLDNSLFSAEIIPLHLKPLPPNNRTLRQS